MARCGSSSKPATTERSRSSLPQLKANEAQPKAATCHPLQHRRQDGGHGPMPKMMSWNRRSSRQGCSSDEEADEASGALAAEEEVVLWRKCRPLRFSGHIAYGSDGNQLPGLLATSAPSPAIPPRSTRLVAHLFPICCRRLCSLLLSRGTQGGGGGLPAHRPPLPHRRWPPEKGRVE
uniref:Uncharacterized protein n=1 Tax=Oryza meridionalis TaxID=40149 RepID=A0A0E0CZU1_9ORYZ